MKSSKKYHLYIDFTTILYRNSVILQEDTIVATHKTHKFKKSCKNITTFKGSKKKELGGWLKDVNNAEGSEFKAEDFDIGVINKITLNDSVGKKRVDEYIRELYLLPWVKDIKFIIDGPENYRYKVFPEYKKNRGDKPLRFAAMKEWFTQEYKDLVIISENCEADDYIGVIGYWSWESMGRKSNIVLGHCDKDEDQIVGLHWNYDKRTQDPYWVDEFAANKSLCSQLLKGDKQVDNILGCGGVTKEMQERYGITGRGLGEAKATKILEGCTKIEDLFKEVEWCYHSVHQDKWKQALNMQFKLVKLMHKKGVEPEYDFGEGEK